MPKAMIWRCTGRMLAGWVMGKKNLSEAESALVQVTVSSSLSHVTVEVGRHPL